MPDKEIKTFGAHSVALRVDWGVGIGGKTWTCGERLCEHLASVRWKDVSVLELGSGTGLVGLYAAKAMPSVRVVLTDVDEHVALLAANIKLNGLEGRVAAEPIDWRSEADLSRLEAASYDVVVATDCAYEAQLHGPLVDALARACREPSQLALVGVTKSDTDLSFFERLEAAGFEYALLKPPRDSYFGLFRVRRRPRCFFAPGRSEETTAKVSVWTQRLSNRASTIVCAQCGCDLLDPEDWVDAGRATIDAFNSGRDDVSPCDCGTLYCSHECRSQAWTAHEPLCVGPLAHDAPLCRFKARLVELDDNDADIVALATVWLARSKAVTGEDPFATSAGYSFEDKDWIPELCGLLGWEGDFAAVLGFVRAHMVEVTRPNALCPLLREVYLGTRPEPASLRRRLLALLKHDVEERFADEGGSTEMSDDHAWSWILAAPEDFLEPVRMLALAFTDVPHSCAPTRALEWAGKGPLIRMTRLHDAPATLWRDGQDDCDSTCCTSPHESLEVLVAAARRDEDYDELDALLQRSPATAATRLELARVAGWRGDWDEARTRLLETAEAYPNDLAVTRAVRELDNFPSWHASECAAMSPVFGGQKQSFLDGRLHAITHVLDSSECAAMTDIVEAHVAQHGWTTSRHYSVPTTDVPVAAVLELKEWFCRQLERRLFPMIVELFDDIETLRVIDAFFVKYSADAQADLPLHCDQSRISLTIAMNPRSDFDGGGTYFPLLGPYPVDLDIGDVAFFDGSLLHAGAPTTRGRRSIIAVFLWAQSP